MSSATLRELDLRNWFDHIRKYATEHKIEDIFKDPRRVLNGDETSFVFDPITKAVVASKGNRNVYLVQKADPKKNVTVLFTFDAEGYMFPPDVILPYKRLSKQVLMSFDPDWGVGKSERGWMDSENFMAYIQNILHSSLVSRNVPLPVIYFVDGHASHTGVEAAELCYELGIILIALYPNATHIMQPADVAIFKPLKNSWAKCVDEWRMMNDGKVFTIEHFGKVLKGAIDQGVSKDTVRSGFRKCGLYPFDADAVDYTRCISKNDRQLNVSECSSNTLTLQETVPVKLCHIKEALKLVNATRIQPVDQAVPNESEKALLYVYNTILSPFNSDSTVDIDQEGDTVNDVDLNVTDVDAVTDADAVADENEFEHNQQVSFDILDHQFKDNADFTELVTHSSPLSGGDDQLALEVNNNLVCENLEASIESEFGSQAASTLDCLERNNNNLTEKPNNKENVLKDITNFDQPDRRISISTFLTVPPTPRRKNVHRNYSRKRHFVLTSAERLKEIEETEKEKERQAFEKEQNMIKRSIKKELKDQEKKERMKIREQKAKDRELNRQLKEQSKKVTVKRGRPKRKDKQFVADEQLE